MKHHYRAVLLILFVLSACKSEGDLAPKEDPVTSSQQMTSIGFGIQELERSVYQPIVDEFNAANPDVQVHLVPLDSVYRDSRNKSTEDLLRQITAAADTTAFSYMPQDDLAQRYLYNLKPLMDADSVLDQKDFYPQAFQSVTRGQHTYMLPHTLKIALLSYNKDLWLQRGLPAPTANWGWREMLASLQQIAQTQNQTVHTYGLIDGGSGFSFFIDELGAAGVDLFSRPLDQLRLDQPEMVGPLEHVADFIKQGVIYDPYLASVAGSQAEDLQTLVLEQRAGLWPADLLLTGSTQTAPTFSVGTLPFPTHSIPYDRRSIEGYIMSRGTQHPDAAWRWLSFLSRQYVAFPWQQPNNAMRLPARTSLAIQSGYWSQLDTETTTAVNTVIARPVPAVAYNASLFEPLSAAIESVVSGKKSAAQALQDAQASLQEQVVSAQATAAAIPPGQSAVVATPVTEVAAPGATRITFSAYDLDTERIRAVAQLFNQQHASIVVAIENTAGSPMPLTVNELAGASDCFVGPGVIPEDVTAALLDMRPLIDVDASFRLDDYPQALLAPYVRQGGLYGLPYAVYLRALRYAPAVFDEAGLAYPSSAWTLADLMAVAEQLTRGVGADKVYGFASITSPAQDLGYFLEQSGALIAQGSGQDLKPNFTDPNVVQAIRSFITLLQRASPHTNLGDDPFNANPDRHITQLITEGRVGMWFEFDGGFFNAKSANRATPNGAMAPPPLPSKRLGPSNFITSGLYISAATQHPEACWEWLKYLSADVTGLGGAFPARISVAESGAFQQQALPGAAAVYAAYRNAFSSTADQGGAIDAFGAPRFNLFWLVRAIDRAMQGGNLELELETAQHLTEQFIDCIRTSNDAERCTTLVNQSKTPDI